MMLRESLKPFFISFTFALLSVWVANKYFSEARQMAICALTALGLSTLLGQLLESNRQAIWQEKISPWIANRKLAFEFISIFLGIFFAAVVIELISNTQHTELDLNAIYRNKIVALFGHNLNVLIIGTALAVVYRAGGLVLILSWNALHWAEAIFSYIKQLKDQVGLSDAAIIFTSILPHLFLEALSYVIAGLAGVFINCLFNLNRCCRRSFSNSYCNRSLSRPSSFSCIKRVLIG